MRPRIYVCGRILVGSNSRTAYVLTESYHHWQATGQNTVNMGSNVRNGIVAALGVAVLAYAGSWA
jgi:hypothetical protein